MKLALAAALLAVAPVYAVGQSTPAAPFALTINYDRPGLNVPHWQIKINPHAAAEYTGKPIKGSDPGAILFAISASGTQRLAELLSRTNGLQPCETHAKGLANMGTKSVDYTAPDGQQSHCTFNYTENKPLTEVMDYALGIANTVQTGLELDRLHRYDRLGLDPVMIRLVTDVKEGRAAEIGAIRPTLQSLATDEAVLDRVRARAQQLLDLAKDQEVAAK